MSKACIMGVWWPGATGRVERRLKHGSASISVCLLSLLFGAIYTSSSVLPIRSKYCFGSVSIVISAFTKIHFKTIILSNSRYHQLSQCSIATMMHFEAKTEPIYITMTTTTPNDNPKEELP